MTVPQLPIADFGIFAPLAVQIMRQLERAHQRAGDAAVY